jgi:hypothetical protein
VLRTAIESAGPEAAPRAVHKTLQALTTSMGNNVHVTSPFDRRTPPAGVVEYDGVESQNGGADLRMPEDGASTVHCTNHYRLRCTPTGCRRYSRLDDMLGAIGKSNARIDAVKAREIMSAIVQDALFSRTLHTVIFFPASRRFELMLSRDDKVAPASAPVAFTLAEVLPPRE